jgi:hypothetical protein
MISSHDRGKAADIFLHETCHGCDEHTMRPLTFSGHDPTANGSGNSGSPMKGNHRRGGSRQKCIVISSLALMIIAFVWRVVKDSNDGGSIRIVEGSSSCTTSTVKGNQPNVLTRKEGSRCKTHEESRKHGSRAYKTGKSPSFVQPMVYDQDPGGENYEWPRIAWVMSFPNSGTSFTMRLVQRMSNITGASNYGMECDTDAKGSNYPVYKRSPDGPFFSQLRKRRMPTRYIPTKTHCGGYTTNSGPEKYIHTARSFMVQCLTGNRLTPEFDEDGNVISARGKALYQVEKHHTHYDPSLVQRAVHVVRDPFDNIVSRFHLEQNVHKKKNDEEWLTKYPSTPQGFQDWCKAMDDKVQEEEKESRFLDDALLKLFEGVPCHSEFYRYTQWHSLALAATNKMKIPALILHYERFEDDFDNMYEELFSFLELPRDGLMTEFVTGKKYQDYFDTDQRRKAMALVEELSDAEVWQILQRYDV